MKPIRELLWIGLVSLTAFVGVTSCVSPVYETARIEPGWKFNLGVCATSFAFAATDFGFYAVGLRADAVARHAPNSWFEASARLGGGVGLDPYYGDFYPLVDGGIGFKFAYPGKRLHPALKLELEPYMMGGGIAPTFLLGIAGERQPEAVTVGIRPHLVAGYIPVGIDLLATIHSPKGHSIFLGIDIPPLFVFESPTVVATAGIGWKFGSKKD
ncbi:hypothetical protein CEE36_04120 [candidate division TA06 bacterium B3_TA06]|uniref:Outer membrane protein beta-barrel domain-containing protein n=1 Tax=candidate division TA06 bacterium B3_TA06 TaxID=2012487 RepID=A0A532V975_UNCT6|nr:MAG: hypothetical protein CEE36_04120 [candidate division TA06 bacterium B3_TA06]